MQNYAIAEALDITLRKLENGKLVPVLYSDYAHTSGLDFSNDTIFAKRRGVDTIRFDKSRKASCKFDFEIYSMKHVALFLGATQSKGTTNFNRVELCTVGETSKFTVSSTPVVESVIAFTVEADGRTHKELLTTSVSGSQVTVSSPSVKQGDQVLVYYLTASGEGSITTTIKADEFAGTYNLVASTVSKNEAGELVPIEFEMFRAVPQGNLSLSLGDSVSTLSVTFDLFPNERKELLDIKEIVAP